MELVQSSHGQSNGQDDERTTGGGTPHTHKPLAYIPASRPQKHCSFHTNELSANASTNGFDPTAAARGLYFSSSLR